MPAEILITGASGLIGSHVVLRFCRESVPVRVLARNPEKAHRQLQTMAGFYHFDKAILSHIEFVKGDLLDLLDVEEAIQGMQAVIHCAGLVSFKRRDCARVNLLNNRCTADLANVALQAGVKWFCHLSSVAALGHSDQQPLDEQLVWKTHPSNSCYAISKYGAEREIWRAMEEGLPAIIFCPSVVTGPSASAMPLTQTFEYIRKARGWFVNGSNGYVDARDVADAVWLAYSRQITGGRFILNGENLSNREFLSICAEAIGRKVNWKSIPILLLHLIGSLGSMLSWFGMGTALPDKKMMNTLRGSRSYRNDLFISKFGMNFRPVKESVQLMAFAAGERLKPETTPQNPGW